MNIYFSTAAYITSCCNAAAASCNFNFFVCSSYITINSYIACTAVDNYFVIAGYVAGSCNRTAVGFNTYITGFCHYSTAEVNNAACTCINGYVAAASYAAFSCNSTFGSSNAYISSGVYSTIAIVVANTDCTVTGMNVYFSTAAYITSCCNAAAAGCNFNFFICSSYITINSYIAFTAVDNYFVVAGYVAGSLNCTTVGFNINITGFCCYAAAEAYIAKSTCVNFYIAAASNYTSCGNCTAVCRNINISTCIYNTIAACIADVNCAIIRMNVYFSTSAYITCCDNAAAASCNFNFFICSSYITINSYIACAAVDNYFVIAGYVAGSCNCTAVGFNINITGICCYTSAEVNSTSNRINIYIILCRQAAIIINCSISIHINICCAINRSIGSNTALTAKGYTAFFCVSCCYAAAADIKSSVFSIICNSNTTVIYRNAVKVSSKSAIFAASKFNTAVKAVSSAKPVYNEAVNFIALACKADIIN